MDIKQSSEKRFALLIDADNVSAKYIKPITDELSKYGTVTYKRIYGDWTLTLHNKWKEALLENSITPIQQFGYTQGKNATDSAMIIDAMDILYTRSVEGFCIVSSDSDFTRLASRIRESGLTVIGMGEKKTPTAFRKACDIFTTLELLLGDSSVKAARGKNRPNGPAVNGQSAGPTVDEIEQAVVNIITDNQNNGKSTGLGEVGSRLLKRYPDFDVRSYGTNLLSKLLDEFGSVQITKDGSSVTVELTEGKDKDAPTGAANDSLDEASEQAKGPKGFKGQKGPKKPKDVQPASVGSASAEQDNAHVSEGKPERTGETRSQQPSEPLAQQSERVPRRRRSIKVAGAGQVTKPSSEQAPQAESPSEAPVATQEASTGNDVNAEAYIRQLIVEAGAEGIALAELGKRVRARYRTFKLRDLGYSQFKNYVADLGDIEVEKRGKGTYAVLGE